MLCLEILVGWNRREEQAADEHERTSAKMSFLLAFIWFKVQGSRFRVQGRGGGFAAFFIGRCSKVAFKSPVTSHSYDTREGIISHAWHEILRLSPHLFWLGGSHIERFRPLRMTIRGSGRVFIWEIRCVFWNYRCYIRYE